MAEDHLTTDVEQVDPQRALQLAAKRENLAGMLMRVKVAEGRYIIKGAPPRLRGPYRTAAGANDAIRRMLRYADAFAMEEQDGKVVLVQTHHTGVRNPDGTLKPIKPPRAQAKVGRPAQQIDPAVQVSDEELEARAELLQAMQQHGVDVGMKVAAAATEAEVFAFPALEAGESPESILERWKAHKGAGGDDPDGLAALADEDGQE